MDESAEEEGEQQESHDRSNASTMVRCCAVSNCCRHFERISFVDVVKRSQSGDLILFDNPTRCNVCLINCFTRSDWDHVAMVVKKPGGGPNRCHRHNPHE